MIEQITYEACKVVLGATLVFGLIGVCLAGLAVAGILVYDMIKDIPRFVQLQRVEKNLRDFTTEALQEEILARKKRRQAVNNVWPNFYPDESL